MISVKARGFDFRHRFETLSNDFTLRSICGGVEVLKELSKTLNTSTSLCRVCFKEGEDAEGDPLHGHEDQEAAGEEEDPRQGAEGLAQGKPLA